MVHPNKYNVNSNWSLHVIHAIQRKFLVACTRLSNPLCLSVHWSIGPSVKLYFFLLFLVADTQLYKRLWPSVCRSISTSRKVGKWAFLKTFCVCLSVSRVLGCRWGLDAPAHPSATILWPCVTCFLVIFPLISFPCLWHSHSHFRLYASVHSSFLP